MMKMKEEEANDEKEEVKSENRRWKDRNEDK